MGEVVTITRKRRKQFNKERWATTDPDTPVEHKGVIARIFRRKGGKKPRYMIFRKSRKGA